MSKTQIDTTIKWGDPPEVDTHGRGRPTVWPQRLAPLLERPGQWARILAVPHKIRNKVDQAANNVRTGQITLPDGTVKTDYEVKVRTVEEDGERITGLYVRYVPEVIETNGLYANHHDGPRATSTPSDDGTDYRSAIDAGWDPLA